MTRRDCRCVVEASPEGEWLDTRDCLIHVGVLPPAVPPDATARSAFLARIHDLGLDALVLDDSDQRPGVMVSQDQLLAILNLLDHDSDEPSVMSLVSQLVSVRALARGWDARAVELDDTTPSPYDEFEDDPGPGTAPTLGELYTARTLAGCARAIFAVTDPTPDA